MSNHPANLVLRFFLEVIALIVIGQWGWAQGEGLTRFLLALGLPALAAAMWVTFGFPEDRPNGKAPVPVSGKARLAVEFLVFGFAIWSVIDRGNIMLALALAFVLLIHYFWSMDRVNWLMQR